MGLQKANKKLWKKTNIGNNVSIGTNATILPVTIVDNVIIGAGAVVTKDILEPGTYMVIQQLNYIKNNFSDYSYC